MTFSAFGSCLDVPVNMSIISPVPSQTLMVNPLRNPFPCLASYTVSSLPCRISRTALAAAIVARFWRRQSVQSTILLLPRLLKPTSGPALVIATANSALLRYLSIDSNDSLSEPSAISVTSICSVSSICPAPLVSSACQDSSVSSLFPGRPICPACPPSASILSAAPMTSLTVGSSRAPIRSSLVIMFLRLMRSCSS